MRHADDNKGVLGQVYISCRFLPLLLAFLGKGTNRVVCAAIERTPFPAPFDEKPAALRTVSGVLQDTCVIYGKITLRIVAAADEAVPVVFVCPQHKPPRLATRAEYRRIRIRLDIRVEHKHGFGFGELPEELGGPLLLDQYKDSVSCSCERYIE